MKNFYYLWAATFLGAGLLAPPMAGLAAQSTPLLRQVQGGGLTLDQLIEIGLDNNSDIRIAERNLSGARAEKRGSYSGLIPSLRASFQKDMDPGKEYLNPITGSTVKPDVYGSRLSISQTIFDGVASWYDASSGQISVKSAERAFDGTRQQTVLAVKQAYYNLLSRLELLEVAEEALELSRKQLELVEERYRLQAVKQTDLLKARVSVGQREADAYNARQNLAVATTNINVIIGQDPAAPINVVRESVVLKQVPERTVALASLEKNNPSLGIQELAVAQARLNAKRQRGVLMPSVSLSYTANSSGPDFADIYNFDFENSSSTFLSFSIPLFTGLQNTSRYGRLRYVALAEEERQVALLRDLKRQLENTVSGLESLHRIYPINQSVLTSAEADVRLANEQYNLGAISILDLLDAQVSLITTRSTLVRTTYEIKIAEAQLAALMGTIGQ